MILALTKHAWLLLMLRHNGDGIPRIPTNYTLLLTVLIAISASWLRWDNHLIATAVGTSLIFWMFSYFLSLRAAVGYMILTAAIDFIAVAVAGTGQQSASDTMNVFSIWETVGVVAFVSRLAISGRAL